MLKVGLTGGIGSGKSTVSNMMKDKNIPVIDADIISREVLDIYPDILKEIEDTFGKEFIDSNGKLKRRQLGNFIFKDKNEREKLENILIPYIKKEIFKRFDEYYKEEYKLCVLDAPTLIENGIHKNMDVNILVWVDRNTQFERVKSRDNLSYDQVENRIKSQMALDDKKAMVDYVIDNSGTLEETKHQLDKILECIINCGEE